MELTIDEEILKAYGFEKQTVIIQQIGSGHINRTYLLSIPSPNQQYILQQINNQVFEDPFAIAENIAAIDVFLKKNHPEYLLPVPIPTLNGELIFKHVNEFWRVLPYISNAYAYDVLSDEQQAYEAAKQFGKLSRLLNDFDCTKLKATIPKFHDLAWRYEQFTIALSITDEQYKLAAKPEIELAMYHHSILTHYQSFEKNHDFPNRVMHHDTKISNVLLNGKDIGVCVIDLDTMMPGKFISDLGDMMRTYLCAYTENERDLDLIKIRLPYFKATVQGYLSEMATILTFTEKELILFSGKYIIYMQALRFLTDYLNGNIYYPTSYPAQNLDRAKNQFKLLNELFENEKVLQRIIEECIKLNFQDS